MKTRKSHVLGELRIAAVDETRAVAFLERQRWGDEPCCPRCGVLDVYMMKTGDWNTRKLDDGQRVSRVVKALDGKRLEYRESVENPPYIAG